LKDKKIMGRCQAATLSQDGEISPTGEVKSFPEIKKAASDEFCFF